MVEVKSICVDQKSFIGVRLHLPAYPSYLIVSTKTILAQDMFDIDYFHKPNNVAVIITEGRYGFEHMLHANVTAMNAAAKACGVTLRMSGKEALLLCEGAQ